MYTLTKEVKQELKEIAGYMPDDFYEVKGYEKISGADAKLSGLEPPVDEEEFDDEKEYLMDMPSFYQVNHFRRLKRAYIKHGVAGVNEYMQPYFDREVAQ